MKKILKKTINAFGIELQRKPKPAQLPVASTDTRNIILELIGPSGIGKSTLHAKMRNVMHYRWNMQYMHPNESDIIPDAGLDEFYRKCLSLKASDLYEREKTFARNTSKLRFFINRAEEDRYLELSGLLRQGGWFLDDGFIHNFTTQILEIIETNSIEKKVLEKFFTGRRFVFLNTSTDYVMENLKERQSKNKGPDNEWLSGYSENDMKYHIQKSFDRKRKLLELSTSYGARFWEVEITGRNDEALGFISSIESDVVKIK